MAVSTHRIAVVGAGTAGASASVLLALATRALRPLFQSDARVLGWLRDLAFPTIQWFPPLRRRMVRTMPGLDRGIVRGAISLDDLRRLALPARVVTAASG